ncbi:MAG: energy-coupling factor ABC transporter permease [Candidatus Altiarchaeota archaeon]
MHIPDGFLTPNVWIPLWAIAAGIIYTAAKKTNKSLGEKQVPLMGVLAAFIFAGQMLNTPVAGGTSGHMLGGVLAAVFLGPWTASIVMASVFIIQALLFQDGGITVLGANIINMGFVGTILGYYIYQAIYAVLKNRALSAGIAGWFSLVLGSLACAVELGLSGTVAMWVAIPAMLSVHVVIGLIEAGITFASVTYVKSRRPDLLELPKI